MDQGSIVSYLRKCRILVRATGYRGGGGAGWVPSSLGKTDKLELSGSVADCRTFLFAPEDEAC